MILARHQIPRRNGLPRRRIDRRAEYRIVNRLLGGAYNSRCTFRQIGGEYIVYLVTGDVEEASGIGPQRFAESGRILLRERADRLVCFGRKSSEVDQRFHVWITRGGATDHKAAIRMSNHHHRAFLRIDEAFGGGNIVSR